MIKVQVKFNIYNSADNKVYHKLHTFYCKKSTMEVYIQQYIEKQYTDCDHGNFESDISIFYYNKYVIVVTYDILKIKYCRMDNLFIAFSKACLLYENDKLERFIYDFEDEEFKINVSDADYIADTILDLTDDVYYFMWFDVEVTKEKIYKYFE